MSDYNLKILCEECGREAQRTYCDGCYENALAESRKEGYDEGVKQYEDN